MADLKGKAALVTGANSALAAGIKGALQEAGATVFVAGDEEQTIAEVFKRIQAEPGGLDLLVNGFSAGPVPAAAGEASWEASISSLDTVSARGIEAAYPAAVHAARLMVAAKKGLIVNLCTRDVAGVERLVRDMARALHPHQVTAIALLTGLPVVASPRFIGRCIAALTMDPDVGEKSAGSFELIALAHEYRFTDPDQQQEI